MEKTKLLTAIFTTFALTACGGVSFSSQSGNSEINFDELSNQPNRTLLRSLASMMSNPGNAMRTNLDVSAEVYSQIVLPNYQTENTFQIAANAELAVNTPEIGNGNAALNVNFERFAVITSSSAVDQDFSWTDEIVVENQTAKLYIEEGFAYVDLSEDATTIARLLFPSENREFPTQFKTPFDLQAATGNFIPQLTEENIDLWIESSLPIVDNLNLVTKAMNGSKLSVGYQITQDDLPTIYERMYLGSNSRDDLNEEELLFIDQSIAEILEAVDLKQFQISFTIDLITNLIEGLMIEIDVENNYNFEINVPRYEPENPDADEYGYVEGNDPFNLIWTYNYAFAINAQMEVLSESIILVAPINKEEYELIDLEAEDPNLF